MAVSAKIKNLAPGAYFNAGPVEVVVLEHFTDGRTLLAAKEPIGNRPFTVRPFTYNRMEPEPAANNFAFSTLRFDLNEDFLSALDDAGVIPANKVLEAHGRQDSRISVVQAEVVRLDHQSPEKALGVRAHLRQRFAGSD